MEKTIATLEVTAENLDSAHICCALGATPDAKACAAAKKEWMRSVYADGYRFHRLDAQGKAFIETVPAEKAWCPIHAPGWLFIDCFWVSGQFKGHGYANQLLQIALERCEKEGFAGLCALSGDKKRPFLSDPGYYKHKGFVEADRAEPFFRLLALPLKKGVDLPKFLPHVGDVLPEGEGAADGVTIVYTQHCPHTGKYVGLLEKAARAAGVPFAGHRLASFSEAQAQSIPFTTWAMYWKGQFVTNEIYSVGKLEKFLADKM